MPKFKIINHEVYAHSYMLEADDWEQAVEQFEDGEGQALGEADFIANYDNQVFVLGDNVLPIED